MYCPECGAEVAAGSRSCPNGHAVGTGTGTVAGKAAEVAQKVAATLGAPSPLPVEARVVVVGLKVLSAVSALFTLAGWWRAASLFAQLGIGGGGPLVGLTLGLTWSLAIYGLALVVQATVRRWEP